MSSPLLCILETEMDQRGYQPASPRVVAHNTAARASCQARDWRETDSFIHGHPGISIIKLFKALYRTDDNLHPAT